MNKLMNSVGFAPVVAGAILLAATSWASAQSTTFAQVIQDSSDLSGNQFAYVNNGPTGDAVLTTDPGGLAANVGQPIAVDFTFLNGLGGALAGVKDIPASLSLNSTTTSLVTPAGGGLVAYQGITGTANVLSITITPAEATILGVSSTNLLSLNNFTGNLIGVIGGSTPQLYGDTELGNTVGYSSGYVDFSKASQEDYSVALSSWTPSVVPPAGLQIASDNYYSAATASAAGTFDFSATVPEPSSTALALGVLALFVGLGRQSRKLTWNRA
jgi:hypothetical protein